MKNSNGYWVAIGVGMGISLAAATGDYANANWIAIGCTFGGLMAAGTTYFRKAKNHNKLSK